MLVLRSAVLKANISVKHRPDKYANVGHNRLSGNLANALCYSSARDVVSMCVNVIKVSVYLQNWSHVISYVNKALATPDLNDGNLKSSDHLTLVTRLKCAGGAG